MTGALLNRDKSATSVSAAHFLPATEILARASLLVAVCSASYSAPPQIGYWQLEEHNLVEEILGTVNLYLQAKGVRITTGTIVDATIIHAPSSTKNRDQNRDPEMHQ